MNKKQIEKKYNALVDRIEGMRIYDGRGTVDRYECQKCGCTMHTTYKDKGVTPFCTLCPECGGTMQHTKTFSKEVVPPFIKVLNWYRPTLKQTLKMPDGIVEYILNGGLILEKS